MPTRADIPREDVVLRCQLVGSIEPFSDWYSSWTSRTKRSLIVAALTILCAGAYYHGVRVSLLDSANKPVDEQMRRVARSSALFALNEMKQALAESWTDRRIVGTYQDGCYRAVAILRRDHGTVRAVGIARCGGEEEARYQVRTDVRRRARSLADASSGYDVILEAPVEETKHNAISPFMESSFNED